MSRYYYYHPYFTDEQTVVQREVTCQRTLCHNRRPSIQTRYDPRTPPLQHAELYMGTLGFKELVAHRAHSSVEDEERVNFMYQ